jgi:hypothetical protein
MSDVVASDDRRIKFLSRDLPFPTDPTFREYRVIQEVTGVTAQAIMTGEAGIWMLPVLAIVAMLRSNPSITPDSLDKILDLDPSQIEVVGVLEQDPPEADEATPVRKKSTGTRSTREIHEESGTQELPTTSLEQPESPTT